MKTQIQARKSGFFALNCVRKVLFLSTFSLLITQGMAQVANADLMKDFDSLGGNDVLLDKAKALSPDGTIKIVQNRIVDRRWRVETAGEFTGVLGGDPYVVSQGYGVSSQVHITPRISFGGKYIYYSNALRDEAKNSINEASLESRRAPDIDYPKSTILGVVNFYPLYGKINVFDQGVVHFDVYALGGAGTTDMRRSQSSTYTAGGGIGFWFSQHLTSRVEMRWQRYRATRYTVEQDLDLTLASLQVGYLF